MQGTCRTAHDGPKRLIQIDEPPIHAHAQAQHLILEDSPKRINAALVGQIDPVAFELEIRSAPLDVLLRRTGIMLDALPMQIGTQGKVLVHLLDQLTHPEGQGHIDGDFGLGSPAAMHDVAVIDLQFPFGAVLHLFPFHIPMPSLVTQKLVSMSPFQPLHFQMMDDGPHEMFSILHRVQMINVVHLGEGAFRCPLPIAFHIPFDGKQVLLFGDQAIEVGPGIRQGQTAQAHFPSSPLQVQRVR